MTVICIPQGIKKTPPNAEISTFRTVFNILARHAGFEPATFAQNIEIPTFTCIVATQGATRIYIKIMITKADDLFKF